HTRTRTHTHRHTHFFQSGAPIGEEIEWCHVRGNQDSQGDGLRVFVDGGVDWCVLCLSGRLCMCSFMCCVCMWVCVWSVCVSVCLCVWQMDGGGGVSMIEQECICVCVCVCVKH